MVGQTLINKTINVFPRCSHYFVYPLYYNYYY